MSGPLYSSESSISHAKRHIWNLQSEINAFLKTEPFARVIDVDPTGRDDIYKIRLVKPMPEPLSGIAFDAVSSLRAALDQAGHAIGVAAGKSGKNSKFPFGDTLAQVHRRAGGTSKDIPKQLFDVMVASAPYREGNKLLWALNKLCNANKHEAISPVAFSTGGCSIDIASFSALTGFDVPPKWDAAKQEMVLAIVPRGSTVVCDMAVETFVAMGKVDGVVGKPAVEVLNTIAGIVADIVRKLEDEGIRLGILN